MEFAKAAAQTAEKKPVVELFGMISIQQMEEQIAGADMDRPPMEYSPLSHTARAR